MTCMSKEEVHKLVTERAFKLTTSTVDEYYKMIAGKGDDPAFEPKTSEEIDEVERILKMEPVERKVENIKIMEKFFEHNVWMKGLAEEYEQRTIHYLYKNMRFAEF